jgi:2-keto-4-pentenoate hydratase
MGLIVGPALPDFWSRPLADWSSQTILNGEVAGHGNADRVPGGPLSALLFLVNNLVSRGLTLRPGDWVSTGASTGIHPVKSGDQVEVSFDGRQMFSLRIIDAVPQ